MWSNKKEMNPKRIQMTYKMMIRSCKSRNKNLKKRNKISLHQRVQKSQEKLNELIKFNGGNTV